METGAITGYIDVAQMILYAFWIFFFGLIFYLQRESRREGYPLVDEKGRKENHGLWMPERKKVFKVKHGDTIKYLESDPPERTDIDMKLLWKDRGSPWVPSGDPMEQLVGPASYAARGDHPDYDLHGEPKLRPLRIATDFYPSTGDDDPRGMTVYGADDQAAGTISDIWVDTGEFIGRYLEVDLADGSGKRLVPWNAFRIVGKTGIFALLSGIEPKKQGIFVHSIRADQFKGIPETESPDQVTLREEDKIMGYVGGGKLYAFKEREEPVL